MRGLHRKTITAFLPPLRIRALLLIQAAIFLVIRTSDLGCLVFPALSVVYEKFPAVVGFASVGLCHATTLQVASAASTVILQNLFRHQPPGARVILILELLNPGSVKVGELVW